MSDASSSSDRSAIRAARGLVTGPLSDPPELVGREHECGLIDALLKAARDGWSASLVIRGETGIGKTALLAYAAERAHGMTVLRTRGAEGEYELAFAGLHALLWPVIDKLGDLPAPQRAALAAALGLASGEGRDRFLVSAGVLSLIAAAAETRPVLCVVDDAQWLDVPSADALVFAARRLMAEGALILFAAREGELRGFEAPGIEDLVLGQLDCDSAGTLLDRDPRPVASSVRARLLSEARGNPLALLELPSRLSDKQLDGEEGLPEALPLNAGLRAVFSHQMSRLPEASKSALLVAAAEEAGELSVILRASAALGLAQDALDPAEQIGLIETDGITLAFRHPLVRSAVYESAPLGRRRRIHGALADALQDEERTERSMWHRAMAALVPDDALAAALEGSGVQAQRRGGHASAVTAFERAARLSGETSLRCRRLVEAAKAAFMAGQVRRANDLVRRALPSAGREQRALLLGLSGQIAAVTGALPDAIGILEEAIGLSEDPSLSLELLLEACALATYVGDAEQLFALCRRASELAPVTDVDRFIIALLTSSAPEVQSGFVGGTPSSEALALAAEVDDARCLLWASEGASRAGNWGDGLPYANRAVQIAREQALVSTLPSALEAQASQLAGRSQFEMAYSCAEESRQLALDIEQPIIWSLVDLATIDALRGREERVHAHVADLQSMVAISGARLIAGRTARALALLDLGLGRPAKALERLLASVVTVRPESDYVYVFGVPDAVEAAVRTQRLDDVTGHYEHYSEWVERFPNRTRLALRARCLALISDSEHEYRRAIELGDELSPFDRARTALLYGEWLRRHRRRVDARPHLREALEVFGQLGLSPWEERARSELRASGETARRRDVSSRDRLTAQELQIARLVAGGMSNPEVAAQLFLSPRTIDYHLRKVFTKLEITSRVELAGVGLGDSLAA